MSEQPNEQGIVRGLRNGDRDAWDALCRHYGGRVCRYVAYLVGHNQDAVGEVFQETMLAVAKSGRALHEGTRLWSWLSRISHNQAALYWRKHYRHGRTTCYEEAAHAATGENPLERLTSAETAQTVRIVLADMPAEQVALLTAKHVEDMSVAAIAEAHGGTATVVDRPSGGTRFEVRLPARTV